MFQINIFILPFVISRQMNIIDVLRVYYINEYILPPLIIFSIKFSHFTECRNYILTTNSFQYINLNILH